MAEYKVNLIVYSLLPKGSVAKYSMACIYRVLLWSGFKKTTSDVQYGIRLNYDLFKLSWIEESNFYSKTHSINRVNLDHWRVKVSESTFRQWLSQLLDVSKHSICGPYGKTLVILAVHTKPVARLLNGMTAPIWFVCHLVIVFHFLTMFG